MADRPLNLDWRILKQYRLKKGLNQLKLDSQSTCKGSNHISAQQKTEKLQLAKDHEGLQWIKDQVEFSSRKGSLQRNKSKSP